MFCCFWLRVLDHTKGPFWSGRERERERDREREREAERRLNLRHACTVAVWCGSESETADTSGCVRVYALTYVDPNNKRHCRP